jgi:peptidoglycan/LPS O-acetylase OafA/YrhL
MLIDRIRRVTRDGRWIPEIDGLRFVAIMSVLLFHILGELGQSSKYAIPVEDRYSVLHRFIGNGDYGVRLFFIISGFILALPFARHYLKGARAVSLRKYFMRRLTRLELPYLLSLLIFVIMLSVYTHHIGASMIRHAAFTALYLHGIVLGQMTEVNAVSWSLEVEIQFYIAAPLFMQLYRVRGTGLRRALIAAMILGAGVCQAALTHSPRATLSILFYIQFFLMGLLLADLYVLDGDRFRRSVFWDAAGVTGLVFSFGMDRAKMDVGFFLPWTMALIFLSALYGRTLRHFFSNQWVATVGGMCYSIYLLHFQFIAALFKATRYCIVPRLDFLANFAIQLVVTAVPVLIACVLFYLLIERPCMDPNWPSRFWHRLTGRSPSAVMAFDSSGISE